MQGLHHAIFHGHHECLEIWLKHSKVFYVV